jgi:hypothetical protein
MRVFMGCRAVAIDKPLGSYAQVMSMSACQADAQVRGTKSKKLFAAVSPTDATVMCMCNYLYEIHVTNNCSPGGSRFSWGMCGAIGSTLQEDLICVPRFRTMRAQCPY